VLNNWYERNKIVLTIIKRILTAFIFFWGDGFEVVIFLLEFITILYVFTIKPYKSEIYLYSAVICRLLLFCFYGVVILGNLYFALGNVTLKYQVVQSYLNSTTGIFLGTVIFIFLFTFYEIYLRLNDLNYKISLVKEENEYKIKLVEKERGDNHSHRKRSGDWKNKRHNSKHKDSLEEPSGLAVASQSFPKATIDLNSKQLELREMRNRTQSKYEENERRVNKPKTKRRSSFDRENSPGKRWKNEYLLNSILKI
jgi:hypothetical protein